MGYQYRGAVHDLEELLPAELPTPSKPGPKSKPRVFNPANRGTMTGYWHHRQTSTQKCQPCLDANAAYNRDWGIRARTGDVQRGFRPDACGTRAGYDRHRRHDVPMCGPCKDATSDYMAEYRAKRRATKRNDN